MKKCVLLLGVLASFFHACGMFAKSVTVGDLEYNSLFAGVNDFTVDNFTGANNLGFFPVADNVNFDNSVLTLTELGGGTLTFDLGDIVPGSNTAAQFSSSLLLTQAYFTATLSPASFSLTNGESGTFAADPALAFTLLPSSGSLLAAGVDLGTMDANSASSSVPEPGSPMLLMTGLSTAAAVLALRRKRKARLLVFAAVLSAVFARHTLAQGNVTLSSTTSPASGDPGLTTFNVTGSGFPTGTIPAANVALTFYNDGSVVAYGTATSVTTIAGTVRRVSFQIPAYFSNQFYAPTFQVAIAGTTSTGAGFSSSNMASLTVAVPAISAINPSTSLPGKTLSVSIVGAGYLFVPGVTVVSFGPGISVGGAPEGAPGPVTMNSAGDLIADLAIDPAALPEARTVTVTTGAQQMTGAFTVTAKEIVLHTFGGALPNAANPQCGLVRDSAGNFYGTALNGGTGNAGVVYKLDAAGHYSVLYNFTGGDDGASPYAALILDSEGNLYGTAAKGGAANAGVVFELTSSGQERVLYSFKGGADGANPVASLFRDAAGNLYGTTENGGGGAGVVFKLAADGEYKVLQSFSLANFLSGLFPAAGVILDAKGNIYGTTAGGGNGGLGSCDGQGTVFKITGKGVYSVLYNFQGCSDGDDPVGNLVFDSAGNIYGTASTRTGPGPDNGSVFKIDTADVFSLVHVFGYVGADGAVPEAGVAFDSQGNLYGTTEYGGPSGCPFSGGFGCGTVFEVSAASLESVLYNFTGGADGAFPLGAIVVDPAGNLYGTTSMGGDNDAGVIFKLLR